MPHIYHRCDAEVWPRDRRVTVTRCQHKAKVERDGRWYCGQHDPVRVAERETARREEAQADAAYKARLAASQRRMALIREAKLSLADAVLATMHGYGVVDLPAIGEVIPFTAGIRQAVEAVRAFDSPPSSDAAGSDLDLPGDAAKPVGHPLARSRGVG